MHGEGQTKSLSYALSLLWSQGWLDLPATMACPQAAPEMFPEDARVGDRCTIQMLVFPPLLVSPDVQKQRLQKWIGSPMVNVLDSSHLDHLRYGSWFSSLPSWSSASQINQKDTLAKSSDWEQHGIILLSCDCIVARLNTYNILWNLPFHHDKTNLWSLLACLFCLQEERRGLGRENDLEAWSLITHMQGDFSYTYFQMHIEPYSNAFCLLENSCSLLLLDPGPGHLIKLGCPILALRHPIPPVKSQQTKSLLCAGAFGSCFDQGL